jgi:DnaJ-class molecular chaperone
VSELGKALFQLTTDINNLYTELARADVTTGHYAPCPAGCANGEFMQEHDCRGMGYAPGGCPICNGLGYIAKECDTCKGEGQIWVTHDEGLEVFNG